MDVLELFEQIRRKPGIYLDGDKSLKRLRSFLVGYECGAATTARELTDHLHFHEFHDWIAKRLGYTSSSSGWCNMILEKSGSDEKAYEMFFELLDEFKTLKTIASET